ncbi:unnamed protein product [Peronospora farinosa]|uniref:FYVE-type domain-containing protein n=1 Tax=Peronospora farinosa TaxID=134698 RepID=A0AAV0USM8_9STRA|nr:unnamed protein product [Peronospora farinosa]
MPQPQTLPSRVSGNSPMDEFKPKPWQVQDRCGICSIEFSLLTKRHHCRSCGLSVCGRHSKNRVIVPTSLSKAQQRVCDSCYPKCRSGMAMELASPAPPVRQDLPADDVRRHTLVLRDGRDDGRRIRSPPDEVRRAAQEARRDRNDGSNRTWKSDEESRDMQSARVRRLRPPGRIHAERGIHETKSDGTGTHEKEIYVQEIHEQEIHVREIYVREIYEQEIHVREIYEQEIHVREIYE